MQRLGMDARSWGKSCRSTWIFLAALLGVLQVPGGALLAQPAEPDATASAAEVVPPRLVSESQVEYPPNAQGDAVIVVTLVVNDDGTVRSVEATGEPPFTDVAIEAVKQWRFEPATRGGTSVAAKIRMEVVFKAPPPPETAPPAAEPANVTQPAAEQEPIEITVEGERAGPTAVTLGTAEVRQIPGAFGDPFRAIDIVPGVVPFTSGLPYFYVRGAPPGNVGYFVDGIRVPYLFHITLGSAVIPANMMESVDLYTGGYPARYGRFAGGIVVGHLTQPNPELHGYARIQLLDAGALVEAGFDEGRGTILAGGRYSYTGTLVTLLSKEVVLDYRDFQFRVSYDVTPKDQISLVSFGAYDVAGQQSAGYESLDFGAEFYRGELRWDRSIGGGGNLRTAVTLGFDQTVLGPAIRAQDRIAGARMELDAPLLDSVTLHVGVDGQLDAYRITSSPYDDPDTPETRRLTTLFPERRDDVIGAYLDLDLEFSPGLSIVPGVRVDRYRSDGTDAVGVDPRLSAKQRLTDSFALVQGVGIVHQPPSFALPLPSFTPGGLDDGLQTAYQSGAGIEWGVLPETMLKAGVFYNWYKDLSDSMSVPPELTNDLAVRTDGRAYGLELFLHRSLTHELGGFVSYTLSRSVRSLDGVEFPSRYDRRHVLSTAASYDLGRRWRAGARFSLYTGGPKAMPEPEPGTKSDVPLAPSDPSERFMDPEREPTYYRLDARIEKLWPLRTDGYISFFVEVLNLTASRENIDGEAVPVIWPNIGVEGGI